MRVAAAAASALSAASCATRTISRASAYRSGPADHLRRSCSVQDGMKHRCAIMHLACRKHGVSRALCPGTVYFAERGNATWYIGCKVAIRTWRASSARRAFRSDCDGPPDRARAALRPRRSAARAGGAGGVLLRSCAAPLAARTAARAGPPCDMWQTAACTRSSSKGARVSARARHLLRLLASAASRLWHRPPLQLHTSHMQR